MQLQPLKSNTQSSFVITSAMEPDKKKFLSYSIKMFKFLRVWTPNDRSVLIFIRKVIVIFIVGVLNASISLSETIEWIRHGDKVAITFTKSLYCVGISVFTHKLMNVAYADNDMEDCIRQLEVMTNKFKDTSSIDASIRLYKKMFIIGYISMAGAFTFFLLAPLKMDEYRALPLKPFFPFFDATQTPYWHLVYIYEVFGICFLHLSSIAYDTLFCGMMSLCSAIIRCITREVEEFDPLQSSTSIDERIRETVEKINEITKISKRISDVFSMTTMVHLMYICSTIALSSFMMTIFPPSDFYFICMAFVATLMVFELWIYCYFGQSIANQRERLHRALYFTEWYDAPKSYKTSLALMIFEAQKDRYVYAGRLIPLSLSTLTNVLNKGFTFYAFLTNTS